MTAMRICPACGEPLEDSSLEGLCPACLIKRALEDWPSTDGEAGTPSEELTATLQTDEARSSERIGPYRLVQLLGRGGMGEVWLAEQEEPVRRKVALKLIQLGMDTKAVIARFEAERQALALMEHPNIAKVFDAGATAAGRPYFVMEHVKGVPITKHCDRHRLNMKQRLDLFMQVCEGVQHAHQKGVIHRDIKPSNVLVTIEGERAVPKIIDFGVAKATAQRLTEKSVFTELGQLIGTPEYMSPEQADLTAQDIDTRSDVYSLGVLLYELLAGAHPFSSRELRRAGFDEIWRRIREEDPPKPSTRLSSLGGERTTAAAKARRTDPGALRRQLAGDLDWITMKALEKDRTRRYGSPNEFAADVRRHLEHEPVLAGPPSTSYRAKKFVRRHRAGVSFAAVLLLVLIGFSAAITVQAGRLARERDRANTEAERANQEATTAKRTSEFMTQLFAIPDPGEERGKTITAKEILDRGAAQIERRLKDEPVVRARLMATMGRTYSSLGLSEKALALLEEALKQQQEYLDPLHPEIADTHCALGMTHEWYGERDQVLPYMERCLTIRRAALAPDDRDLVFALASVAWSYRSIPGRREQAAPLGREARAVCQRSSRPMGWECSDGAMVLAQSLVLPPTNDPVAIREAIGLTDEAVEAYQRVRREGGYWNPLISTLREAAITYSVAGEPEKALKMYVLSYEHQIEELGPQHPIIAQTLANGGILLREMGRYTDARKWLEQAVALLERSSVARPLLLSNTRGILGTTLLMLGEYDRALPLQQEYIARHELGSVPRWQAMQGLLYLAYNRHQTGQPEEARSDYRRAIKMFRNSLAGKVGPNNPTAIQVIHQLAKSIRDAGEDEDALDILAIAAASCLPNTNTSWAYYHDPYLRTRIHEDYAAQLGKMGHAEEASIQGARAEELRAQARAREEVLEAADKLP